MDNEEYMNIINIANHVEYWLLDKLFDKKEHDKVCLRENCMLKFIRKATTDNTDFKTASPKLKHSWNRKALSEIKTSLN